MLLPSGHKICEQCASLNDVKASPPWKQMSEEAPVPVKTTPEQKCFDLDKVMKEIDVEGLEFDIVSDENGTVWPYGS